MSKTVEKTKNPFRFRLFKVEWSSFWTLLKMLLANSHSLDFRRDKKKAIIKIVLAIVGFAAVAGISFLFFYLCIRFSIFSLLNYVPMSVPSIIVTILLIFSFLGSLSRVTEDLYFASDNKILLTLPVDGNTLFLARLSVCFINTYLKALALEVPLLIGYFLVSGYPVYMCFAIFFVWAIIDAFLLLLASVLSVPTYYFKRFLRTHTLANALVLVSVIVLLLGACSFLIAIIPNRIDIFSNWGPYFAKIQSGLSFYTTNLSFFYGVSMVYLGGFTGFSFSYFSGYGISGLWTFVTLIGAIPLLFLAALSLANPLYLRLASGSGELQSASKTKKQKEEKVLSPLMSQLKKEALLFFKDGDISPNYVGIFLALPLLLALIGKLFGAMDINSLGEAMVQVADLLILMLLSLSTNSLVARIYSKEGGAFKLNRTYPLKDEVVIGSKLLLPGIIGSLSIISSVLVMGFLRPTMMAATMFSGFGALLAYLGHLLFSAGLDFSNPKEGFGEASFLQSSENRSAIMAFLTSGVMALLYYYFQKDPILLLWDVSSSAGFKILLIGALYLALNVLLYVRKIRYVYRTGESL